MRKLRLKEVEWLVSRSCSQADVGQMPGPWLLFPAAAKSLQLCLTLCDPIDGSPPGSPVPEILQARTVEWVAISFSNAWKWKVKVKSLSRVRLFATPWTAAYQAPPSIGFSRQEYWSGVPLPSPYPLYSPLFFPITFITIYYNIHLFSLSHCQLFNYKPFDSTDLINFVHCCILHSIPLLGP